MPRKFTIDRARAEQIAAASEAAFEAARQAGAETREISDRIARIKADHRQKNADAGGRYSPPVSDLEKIALLRASIPSARDREAKANAIAQQTGRLAERVGELTANPRRSLGGIEIARRL